MTLITSSSFASAAAAGTDWRDAAKSVLEQLEKAITEEGRFNIGFLYVTDALTDDAQSILTLFRSVTGVENWLGCTGLGVCASGREYIDEPAISAMIGTLDPECFRTFPVMAGNKKVIEEALGSWAEKKDPMLVLVHGDPLAEIEPAQSLALLSSAVDGFVVGGLSSSRTQQVLFSGDVMNGGLCGAVFSSELQVSTALSQGCRPIGGLHGVTRCEDHNIYELDGRSPIDVFHDDIRTMVISRTGQNPDEILVEDDLSDVTALPRELGDILKGEVHVAFPVSGSDQQDYMVRNIIGMDPDEDVISVAHTITVGDHILFAHRDDDTIRSELSSMLLGLRERVKKERGEFRPVAGLFISCAARAFSHMQDYPEEGGSGEMALIKEIIGDIPITGFYAGGEISGNRLYGYTGILTLFF